jgi:hypothetical protein
MKKERDTSSLGRDEEVQTSIRMSRKLLTKAKHYAIDNNRSLAAIFVEALEEYLENH